MLSDESCDSVHNIATQPLTSSQLAAVKLLWCCTALQSGLQGLPYVYMHVYMHAHAVHMHVLWCRFWRFACHIAPALAAHGSRLHTAAEKICTPQKGALQQKLHPPQCIIAAAVAHAFF
ncbi:TPA: hypothetical protein ACH3X2_009085 [Trebouxia sp. C0005]